VTFETLPSFELGSFDDISLERPIAPVTDEDVEKSIQALVDRVREFEPKAEGAKAEKGDKLTIDFTGKLDGVAFEGGTGGDVDLVLGSGSFIPGFEISWTARPQANSASSRCASPTNIRPKISPARTPNST